MQVPAPVILFDGVCNLCNRAVLFIIKHDPRDRFRFAALQSAAGIQLTQQYGIPQSYGSVVLIENGRAYLRSAAALRIARRLNGAWPLLYICMLVPAFIRDRLYNWVARNRYRWFGSAGQCMRPTARLQAKFLE
ncbi:DCC1-like thiol-disulfide oxidoreductase family protein [Niabella pedocola]|uniref:DCC1-like thiol-disulfide oxidoreductase family protein n=1 Tax=Niabella pedocola TaxID=1752077 RepID=A0ABS8PQP3_9BACT|nr:DCC1-like thiol-disulfide oxidoreductase family protein [Niabella pedocola]MCD2423403.1 DCC1-like thiol-disulfide oxidoreductase family protein [Niabella pedocola]